MLIENHLHEKRRYSVTFRCECFHSIRVLLLEVVIDDSGVGIPARQAQKLKVEDPKAELERALADRGSCKMLAQDCRIRGMAGYGFTYIIDALSQLEAKAFIRTDGLLYTFNGKKFIYDNNNLHPPICGTMLAATVTLEQMRGELHGRFRSN
jgi:hypothetical protein